MQVQVPVSYTHLGIPIVNKRISVTPVSLIAAGTGADSYVPVAKAMDAAAQAVGVNYIGGFSALVHKGYSDGDRVLINSIPKAVSYTHLDVYKRQVSTIWIPERCSVRWRLRPFKRGWIPKTRQGLQRCFRNVNWIFASKRDSNTPIWTVWM